MTWGFVHFRAFEERGRSPEYSVGWAWAVKYGVLPPHQRADRTRDGRVEFAYDGVKPVGSGRVEMAQPVVFSADETTDIGDDVHDHYIDPEERFRIAMARQ